MPYALVIDDEPTIRTTLARFLSREGWEVATCESADEAVTRLTPPDARPPALLLCDARLPGRSAAEFHAWLLVHQPALADRLVVMTGDPSGPAVPAGVRPPPILHKPFEFEQLRRLLRERSAVGVD